MTDGGRRRRLALAAWAIIAVAVCLAGVLYVRSPRFVWNSVWGGHTARLKLALVLGADVDTRNEGGETPLLWAASAGEVELARLLIRHGADLHVTTEDGFRPLHRAIGPPLHGTLAESAEMVVLLIESGADVNAAAESGWTPLLLAAQRGHVELAELLVRRGADVNVALPDGQTALHTSAFWGHTEVAELLIEHGADVNAKTDSFQTALQLAEEQGHTAVAALLKQHGATE
jgi:ankyrin repeat protein